MFPKNQIKRQQTYKTLNGKLIYVQEIEGQRVTFCDVGSVDRMESSLGRFAARIASIEPNQ